MSNVNRKSKFVEHILSVESVGRLSGDMKGYVRSFDNFTGTGSIVGEDHRIYRLKRPNLLSYASPGAYERVVFQRELTGMGDVAMNVRIVKW